MSKDALELLSKAPKSVLFGDYQTIAAQATGGADVLSYEVSYTIPEKGSVKEVIVNKVNNWISVNYPKP